MIVLVCGSRTFSDQALVNRILDEVHPSVVVHGDASGADRLAKRWALANAVPQRAYPAEWSKYGRRAGPLRNQRMIDSEPLLGLGVAFPGGVGTADMVRRLEAAGIPVRKITY